MSDRSEIRRFFQLLRPEAGHYVVGLASLLGVNIFEVLAPIFLAVAVDLVASHVGGPDPTTPPILRMMGIEVAKLSHIVAILAFFGLQLGANIFRYPMLYFTAVPSQRIGQVLRNAITGHLTRLSMSFYDRARSGDLMSRATADVNQVRMMYGPGILVGVDTVFLLTLVIGIMLSLSWKLTLIAMIPLPLIALVTNRLSLHEYRRWDDVQEDLSELTARVHESFAGIRLLQAYAREAFDRARFQQSSERHLKKQLHLAKIRSVFTPTLELMTGLSIALILLFGGRSVVQGTLSIGTFVAFLFLVGFISGPMMGFGWSVSLFQRGRASLQRIDSLLHEAIDVVESPDALDANGPGEIEIRGLNFSYPVLRGEPGTGDEAIAPAAPSLALSSINLHIPAGTTLGIIGPVGSGKSTLGALLVRLYDPPRGTIFLDGVDILDLKFHALRKTIMVAPQDTFLFGDTAERNISLGVYSREKVEEATRLALLHDELLELEHGYDTMLGERGVNLSGGQRQRIAIARAIIGDPPVLLLDDCLSAVDARTEEAILKNLRQVFEARTGIVISHRVIAVQDCDHIIVLDEGRIAESGRHGELMAQGGYYARIAEEQGIGAGAEDAPQDGATTGGEA